MYPGRFALLHTLLRAKVNSTHLLAGYLHQCCTNLLRDVIISYNKSESGKINKSDIAPTFPHVLKSLWQYSAEKIVLLSDTDKITGNLYKTAAKAFEYTVIAEANTRNDKKNEDAQKSAVSNVHINVLKTALLSASTNTLIDMDNLSRQLLLDMCTATAIGQLLDEDKKRLLGCIRLQAIFFCNDWNQQVIHEDIIAQLQ